MKTSKPRSMMAKTKIFLLSLLSIVALSFALPFTGLLMVGGGDAVAQDKGALTAAQKGFGSETNPRSNFWRAVRGGNSGYSAIKGTETGVLIQNGGENWRSLRKPISYYGWMALATMAVLIVLFQLIRGSVRLKDGRSGTLVKRWGGITRSLHWIVAISFIVLAVTGLSLLYGKAVLIPFLGKDAFAAWAALAKLSHDYVGPVFGVSLILLLLTLLPHNLPNGTDIKWLLSGGGLFGKNSHSPAGRINGGEKVWYWLLATFGIAVILSGAAMLFLLDLTREQSQLAMMIHAAGAMIITAVSLGHIYIGTAGTEGSLEAMTTGKVDLNWAKQHHDLWVDDLQKKGKVS